jgi:hypothetical protein
MRSLVLIRLRHLPFFLLFKDELLAAKGQLAQLHHQPQSAEAQRGARQ